jgi:hypothetical protein
MPRREPDTREDVRREPCPPVRPKRAPNNDARRLGATRAPVGIKLCAGRDRSAEPERIGGQPWSLLPWPRADAVRAQRDAAGPRRRLRTPPAPRPMPPRRSGSWTFCVRDERSHELTRPARATRHGTEAPDHSERARAPLEA